MKKILYVSFLNEDIRPGYKNKIHSQCEAFSNLGFQTYLFIVNNSGVILYEISSSNERIIKQINPLVKFRFSSKRNIVDELLLFNFFIRSLIDCTEEIKPDKVYIRRVIPITFKLIKTISLLKKRNIDVIYEYPTFPWEKEMINYKQFLFYVIDKLLYKHLVNVVSKVVVVGTIQKLGDKFTGISNAISTNRLPKRLPTFKKDEKTIVLIGVAHVSIFHGYDRIIKGLKIYYQSNNQYEVIFNIVGPVDKNLKLEKMVEDYGLNKYVNFVGYKTGQELDKMFNEADIGVGCLGVHRKGIEYLNSLKNREYAARGIPFIFSEQDEIIEKQRPNFILKLSGDDNPININEIVDFYNTPKESIEEIREFAKRNLSWDSQMKKVIEE